MTLHKPLLMQPAGGDADLTYSGAEIRALVAAQYPFEGLVPVTPAAAPADFKVTQRGAGANLSVDVAAGMAVVKGDDVAGQNTYLCWSDATANLALPAAPGTGTRTHRVGLRVKDKLASGAWTTYEFVPDYVADGGGGLPAEPSSFLTLAAAQITAGQSAYTNAQLSDYRALAGPHRKWKTGYDTRSTITRTPDADLAGWRILAGATYRVLGAIGYWSSGGGDLGLSLDLPGSVTGGFKWIGYKQGDLSDYAKCWWANFTDALSFESGATLRGVDFSGTFSTSAAGVLNLSWGSLTAGVGTAVQGGSWLEVERIA